MSTKASRSRYCMTATWSQAPPRPTSTSHHVVVERQRTAAAHDMVQRDRPVAAVGLGAAETGLGQLVILGIARPGSEGEEVHELAVGRRGRTSQQGAELRLVRIDAAQAVRRQLARPATRASSSLHVRIASSPITMAAGW